MSEDQYGAVVTSPPYNIGIDYGEFKDKLEDDDFTKEFHGDYHKPNIKD